MRFFSFVFLLVVPATVSACEGDCIVGITNAWLTNYTAPISLVFNSMASQISDLIPEHPPPATTLRFLDPIMSAYHKMAYQSLETAIFPGFFHGKCLDADGKVPPNCPNPDCPIVCGTPGSLVHFYSKLRWIVFNETYHTLEKLSTPGTDAYQQVEQSVLAAADGGASNDYPRRSYSRVFARGGGGLPLNLMQNNQGSGPPFGVARPPPPPAPSAVDTPPAADEPPFPGSPSAGSTPGQPVSFLDLLSGGNSVSSASSSAPAKKLLPVLKARRPDIKDGLKSIMQQIRVLLNEACGGDGEDTDGLPDCSWEKTMKDFILSYP